MTPISFVIPYRYLPERPYRIARLCKWLIEHAEPGMEIIVSDQSVVPALEHQRLRRVYEPRDKFNKSRAINQAVKLATTNWICVLDVDVIPPADFIDALRGLTLAYADYHTFTVMEGDRPHFDPPFYWGSDIYLFSRDLWEKAGGYCEDYEGYGYEDVDFCDRCIEAGAQVVQLPIVVQHDPHPQVTGIHESIEINRAIYEGRK